jgi:hypothetical protein
MRTILRTVLLAPLLAGLAAVAGPTAASASAGGTPAATKQIGHCRAHGAAAHCQTHKPGTVMQPISIHVHVTATPNQPVTVVWAMTCGKGAKTKSKHGTITRHTPLTRKLKLPMSHPDLCGVSAIGQLSGSGKIHVWLTATT